MKKTYQTPSTIVAEIELQQMVAASELIKNNAQDLSNAPETTETSGNLSRRRTVWDDDEEEEEGF